MRHTIFGAFVTSNPSYSNEFRSPLSLRESVYLHIKKLIMHNMIAPGEVIAVDRMATMLGVSRTPVREALLLLEGDALVTSAPNHGFVTTEISASHIEHVFEVRRILESHAAYTATPLISESKIEALGDLFNRAVAEIRQGSYELCDQCDLELHGLILENCGNPVLAELVNSLVERTLRIRYLANTPPELYGETIMEEHTAVLRALRSRNADEARLKMETHLLNACERTHSCLKSIRNKQL